MDQERQAQLRAVVEAKLKTHARSTVTLIIDVVRGCLQAAVEDEIIETNAAAKLGKLPCAEDTPKE